MSMVETSLERFKTPHQGEICGKRLIRFGHYAPYVLLRFELIPAFYDSMLPKLSLSVSNHASNRCL